MHLAKSKMNDHFEILEKPSYQWGRAEKVVRAIYNSCMNEEALTKEGVEPLKKFVTQLEGWSFSSNKPIINESWSLESLLLRMYDMNFNPILLVSVVTDDKNTSRHVIAVMTQIASLFASY